MRLLPIPMCGPGHDHGASWRSGSQAGHSRAYVCEGSCSPGTFAGPSRRGKAQGSAPRGTFSVQETKIRIDKEAMVDMDELISV